MLDLCSASELSIHVSVDPDRRLLTFSDHAGGVGSIVALELLFGFERCEASVAVQTLHVVAVQVSPGEVLINAPDRAFSGFLDNYLLQPVYGGPAFFAVHRPVHVGVPLGEWAS